MKRSEYEPLLDELHTLRMTATRLEAEIIAQGRECAVNITGMPPIEPDDEITTTEQAWIAIREELTLGQDYHSKAQIELHTLRATVARLMQENETLKAANLAWALGVETDSDRLVKQAEAENVRLKAENDRFAKRHSAQALTIAQYQAECDRLRKVLKG